MPNFREMLKALDSPQMYRLYQEGSQFVHGSMYATSRYRKNLGAGRVLGDFTSTIDWILPVRLCWLSLREATWFILDRLEVPEEARPKWNELNAQADAALQALASYAAQAHQHDAEM